MKQKVLYVIAVLLVVTLIFTRCTSESKKQRPTSTKVIGFIPINDSTNAPFELLREEGDTFNFAIQKWQHYVAYGKPVIDTIKDQAGIPLKDSTGKIIIGLKGYEVLPDSLVNINVSGKSIDELKSRKR